MPTQTESIVKMCRYLIANTVTDFENYVSEHFRDEFSGISYEAWHEDALNCDDVEHIYKTAFLVLRQLT